MNRDELEQQAKHAICPCFAYDLADNIEAITNSELQRIVEIPYICHVVQQQLDPVDTNEFVESLNNCPEFKEA